MDTAGPRFGASQPELSEDPVIRPCVVVHSKDSRRTFVLRRSVRVTYPTGEDRLRLQGRRCQQAKSAP